MFQIAEDLRFFFQRRHDSFNLILKLLSRKEKPVTILETGTTRISNCPRNGCSTILWSRLVDAIGGRVITIDHNPEAILNFKKFTGYKVNIEYVVSDSVEYLRGLTPTQIKEIDLFYLDSFDLSENYPQQSQAHHLMELLSVWPFISNETYIMVDDCRLIKGEYHLSKAEYILPFLKSQEWRVINDEWEDYQLIFESI